MDVEEAEYNIQMKTTDNRKTVWQAKYIELDTPNFISKWTTSGILFYSRKERMKSKANPGHFLRVSGGWSSQDSQAIGTLKW